MASGDKFETKDKVGDFLLDKNNWGGLETGPEVEVFL